MTTVVERTDQRWLEDDAPREIVRFMGIDSAVDLWLGELERKGRSPSTIREYRRILYDLADQLGGVDIGEVSTTMLRRFLDSKATSSRKWDAGRKKAAGTRKVESVAVDCLFDWLNGEGIIRNNPTRRNGQRILGRPALGRPEDNPNVVRVSTPEAMRLLEAARTWDEKLAIYTLVYLGPRRHALALARITDFDPVKRTLTFREKGSKTITKPVPDRLVDIIEGARAAGQYDEQDYLVPNRHRRPNSSSTRDDRVIYRIVKEVAERAGIPGAHVHSLRAAFAVKFLEDGKDRYDLQLLLGHSSPSVTDVYVRYLDKQQRMESVRDLDWGVAPTDTNGPPQIA